MPSPYSRAACAGATTSTRAFAVLVASSDMSVCTSTVSRTFDSRLSGSAVTIPTSTTSSSRCAERVRSADCDAISIRATPPAAPKSASDRTSADVRLGSKYPYTRKTAPSKRKRAANGHEISNAERKNTPTRNPITIAHSIRADIVESVSKKMSLRRMRSPEAKDARARNQPSMYCLVRGSSAGSSALPAVEAEPAAALPALRIAPALVASTGLLVPVWAPIVACMVFSTLRYPACQSALKTNRGYVGLHSGYNLERRCQQSLAFFQTILLTAHRHDGSFVPLLREHNLVRNVLESDEIVVRVSAPVFELQPARETPEQLPCDDVGIFRKREFRLACGVFLGVFRIRMIVHRIFVPHHVVFVVGVEPVDLSPIHADAPVRIERHVHVAFHARQHFLVADAVPIHRGNHDAAELGAGNYALLMQDQIRRAVGVDLVEDFSAHE